MSQNVHFKLVPHDDAGIPLSESVRCPLNCDNFKIEFGHPFNNHDYGTCSHAKQPLHNLDAESCLGCPEFDNE